MIALAIIADDLTGALDAAAPFSGLDGGAIVATRTDAIADALATGPTVLAVSTRSRDLDPKAANRAVAAALAALPNGVRLFKKIDSRLKGNIASELSAFDQRPLLVAPAIPDFGRVVRRGALTGFGVPTPIPVRNALGPFSSVAAIPDTTTPTDMDDALAEAPDDALLVGARGLAGALARQMNAPPTPDTPPLPKPLCIAAGSSDPITLAQIDELRSASPSVLHVPAPSGKSASMPPNPMPPISVLQATRGAKTAPGKVARDFAVTARAWLSEARSMILTGGATAEVCLDALGIDVLRLAGEPIAGIPVSLVDGKTVVTKSGGFGASDALLRLTNTSHTVEA